MAESSLRSAIALPTLRQHAGIISTSPQATVVERFDAAGGTGKPRYGQVTVCWAADETQARRTAYEIWPNAANEGEQYQQIRYLTPSH